MNGQACPVTLMTRRIKLFGESVTIDYNLASCPDHPTLADGFFEAAALSSN
jgi:hypothetical protein